MRVSLVTMLTPGQLEDMKKALSTEVWRSKILAEECDMPDSGFRIEHFDSLITEVERYRNPPADLLLMARTFAEQHVTLKPVVIRDMPDAHNIWLTVGVQSFCMTPYGMERTRDHANWFRDRMVDALAKMIATALIADREARQPARFEKATPTAMVLEIQKSLSFLPRWNLAENSRVITLTTDRDLEIEKQAEITNIIQRHTSPATPVIFVRYSTPRPPAPPRAGS